MELDMKDSCLAGSTPLMEKQRLEFLNVEIDLADFFFTGMMHPAGNVTYELLTKLQQNELPIFHAGEDFAYVKLLKENIICCK
jgi:hypothetical protein